MVIDVVRTMNWNEERMMLDIGTNVNHNDHIQEKWNEDYILIKHLHDTVGDLLKINLKKVSSCSH